MAQAHREEKIQENPKMEIKERHSESFKFNVQAPEFIPRSQTQMPISGYFYPCFHILGGAASPYWFYVGDTETPANLITNANINLPNCSSKTILSEVFHQKIIKQVFIYFIKLILGLSCLITRCSINGLYVWEEYHYFLSKFYFYIFRYAFLSSIEILKSIFVQMALFL